MFRNEFHLNLSEIQTPLRDATRNARNDISDLRNTIEEANESSFVLEDDMSPQKSLNNDSLSVSEVNASEDEDALDKVEESEAKDADVEDPKLGSTKSKEHRVKSGRVGKNKSQNNTTILIDGREYYSCTDCSKPFTTESGRTRHKCSKKKNNSTIIIVCQCCDKTFQTTAGRTKHMQTKHRGDEINKELEVSKTKLVTAHNKPKTNPADDVMYVSSTSKGDTANNQEDEKKRSKAAKQKSKQVDNISDEEPYVGKNTSKSKPADTKSKVDNTAKPKLKPAETTSAKDNKSAKPKAKDINATSDQEPDVGKSTTKDNKSAKPKSKQTNTNSDEEPDVGKNTSKASKSKGKTIDKSAKPKSKPPDSPSDKELAVGKKTSNASKSKGETIDKSSEKELPVGKNTSNASKSKGETSKNDRKKKSQPAKSKQASADAEDVAITHSLSKMILSLSCSQSRSSTGNPF